MSQPQCATGNWGIRFTGDQNESFVAAVAKELDEMLMWEAIAAEAEQRELAEYYKDHPPMKCVDGIGPQILAISRTAFIHYKAVEKLDFSNPRDIQYLINRHPHMAVRGGKQTVKDTFRSAEIPKPKEISQTPGRNVRETVNLSRN